MVFLLKNGDMYEIRSVIKEDAKKILEFTECVSVESDNLTFGKNELDITLNEEIKFLEKMKLADNQVMFLAIYNKEIVGILSYTGGTKKRTRHCGEFGVVVRKEYWNNGIAKQLIIMLFDWAKLSKYCEKVNLRVREDNEKAISLYKKLGFNIEGKIIMDLKIGDYFYDSLFMGKKIK